MKAVRFGAFQFVIYEDGNMSINASNDAVLLNCQKTHELFNLLFEYRLAIMAGSKIEQDRKYVPEKQGRQPKMHCINGHKYTPENTLMQKNGTRMCKACRSVVNRNQYEKRKAKAI